MRIKQIIESGFIKAFIAEYFEDKMRSFYPDKDRLLYALCSTDLEKQQVTVKQIENIKGEIQQLGNEQLSFAYLLSGKPKSISGNNYIEADKRFDSWLNRFCEEFTDSINTFTPIIEACKLFKNNISNEDFENEFWEMYPASQKPKENCLPFVIQRESELLNEIENTIGEYKENEYWEFDFEEYQKFIDTSKPIELLFNLSELLLQLKRLEMFNKSVLPPQQIETKTDKFKAELVKYGFFELPKVTQLSDINKQSLVEIISAKGLPYSVAMFEYLEFLKYLKAEHFKTDNKLFKALADWFEVTERTIKGNIYVLDKVSKENRKRYTADQQKQIAQNDYKKLI